MGMKFSFEPYYKLTTDLIPVLKRHLKASAWMEMYPSGRVAGLYDLFLPSESKDTDTKIMVDNSIRDLLITGSIASAVEGEII